MMTKGKKDTDALKIIAMGGLGEIGLNMMLFECEGRILVIDCGLMFPDEQMSGVDLVIQDTSYLEGREDDLEAVILTHGHEDHIGALPFFLRNFDAPIYGTPLTLGLARGRLKEHGLLETTRLNEINAASTLELGPFRVEFYAVSHSVADGVALAVSTKHGLVVHSGDFKLDQAPLDGRHTDLGRLAELGRRGITLFMSDSTNVEREGYTSSELSVGQALDDIFRRENEGWIMVATFSSNIHRMQQVIDVSLRHGRKVVLNGRSIVMNTRVAESLGYLHVPPNALVDLKKVGDYPRNKLTLLTTGSQGEPLSALARMAMNDHKQLKVLPGDALILSSRFIPGNEKAIDNIVNCMYQRGARVYYEKVARVHASGHASSEELKIVFNVAQPQYFMPIHGEPRHLVRHRDLVCGLGCDHERCVLALNGDVVTVRHGRVEINGSVHTGRVLIDGRGIGDVGDIVLRDRRNLANSGMVVVIVILEKQTGEIISGPDIISRGFVFEDESSELLDEAKDRVRRVLEGLSLDAKSHVKEAQEEVRRELRRFFNKKLERRPMVLPFITGV